MQNIAVHTECDISMTHIDYEISRHTIEIWRGEGGRHIVMHTFIFHCDSCPAAPSAGIVPHVALGHSAVNYASQTDIIPESYILLNKFIYLFLEFDFFKFILFDH